MSKTYTAKIVRAHRVLGESNLVLTKKLEGDFMSYFEKIVNDVQPLNSYEIEIKEIIQTACVSKEFIEKNPHFVLLLSGEEIVKHFGVAEIVELKIVKDKFKIVKFGEDPSEDKVDVEEILERLRKLEVQNAKLKEESQRPPRKQSNFEPGFYQSRGEHFADRRNFNRNTRYSNPYIHNAIQHANTHTHQQKKRYFNNDIVEQMEPDLDDLK
jgi:hypothetical protein